MKRLLSLALALAVTASPALAQPHGEPVTGDPQSFPSAPANGPGVGQPRPDTGPHGEPVGRPLAGAPAGRARPAPPPAQLTPQEQDQLKDIEAEYDRFVAAANTHDTRMRAIAKREYDSRTG
ncbi:MAG TPA: hypothetical protein VGC42_00005, partial [Kofleriaceae bacterium]